MKKYGKLFFLGWSSVFYAFLLFNVSTVVQAGELNSKFGFTIEVPDQWLVLSKNDIGKSEGKFNDAFQKLSKMGVNQRIVNIIKSKISNGQMEIIYVIDPEIFTAKANINVYSYPEAMPSEDSVSSHCDSLPATFSKLLSKEITFYECGLEVINGREFLYTIADGIGENTKVAQYQTQLTINQSLYITLTSHMGYPNSFAESNKLFTEAVETISFD